MQRLLFDFLFFSLGGTVSVIAICTLQAGRQSDRKEKAAYTLYWERQNRT